MGERFRAAAASATTGSCHIKRSSILLHACWTKLGNCTFEVKMPPCSWAKVRQLVGEPSSTAANKADCPIIGKASQLKLP